MKTKQHILSFFFVVLTLTAVDNKTFAQMKVGSNPNTIGTTSNLEVEATNGKKTIVDKTTGKVTIQDGTEGAGKVLTSDANGASSWQALSAANIPEIVFIATTTNTLANPYSVGYPGNNSLVSRIPFTPIFGTGYDATQKLYQIQSAGVYRITGGLRCHAENGTSAQLVLIGAPNPSDIINIGPGNSLAKTFTVVAVLNTGSPVGFYVDAFSSTIPPLCYEGFLTVEKLK